jgi:hypothetical protein
MPGDGKSLHNPLGRQIIEKWQTLLDP